MNKIIEDFLVEKSCPDTFNEINKKFLKRRNHDLTKELILVKFLIFNNLDDFDDEVFDDDIEDLYQNIEKEISVLFDNVYKNHPRKDYIDSRDFKKGKDLYDNITLKYLPNTFYSTKKYRSERYPLVPRLLSYSKNIS